MERDKAIKLGVASAIGLLAVVILAKNFLGKGPPKPSKESLETPVTETAPGGGGRLAPGAKE